jgi:hypothetical protein
MVTNTISLLSIRIRSVFTPSVKDVPGRYSYSQHHIYTGTSDYGWNGLADWTRKSSGTWESRGRGREHLDGKHM